MSNRRKTGSNAARNRSGKHEEKATLLLGDMEKKHVTRESGFYCKSY